MPMNIKEIENRIEDFKGLPQEFTNFLIALFSLHLWLLGNGCDINSCHRISKPDGGIDVIVRCPIKGSPIFSEKSILQLKAYKNIKDLKANLKKELSTNNPFVSNNCEDYHVYILCIPNVTTAVDRIEDLLSTHLKGIDIKLFNATKIAEIVVIYPTIVFKYIHKEVPSEYTIEETISKDFALSESAILTTKLYKELSNRRVDEESPIVVTGKIGTGTLQLLKACLRTLSIDNYISIDHRFMHKALNYMKNGFVYGPIIITNVPPSEVIEAANYVKERCIGRRCYIHTEGGEQIHLRT